MYNVPFPLISRDLFWFYNKAYSIKKLNYTANIFMGLKYKCEIYKTNFQLSLDGEYSITFP